MRPNVQFSTLCAVFVLCATINGDPQISIGTPSDNSNVSSTTTVDGFTDLDDTDLDRITTTMYINYDNPALDDVLEGFSGASDEITLFNYQWQQNEPLDPLNALGDWGIGAQIDGVTDDFHSGETGPGGPA